MVKIGDKVIMRKKHPCGSDEWVVVRTGADVKIKCCKCGRIIMFSIEEFEKAVKKIEQ